MGPVISPLQTGFPPQADVLAVDGEVVSYADLTAVAMLAEEWEPFVHRARRGAYLATCREIDQGALRQAGQRFRRDRALVAADDLKEWLVARSLARSDWEAALARSLLLEGDEGRDEGGGEGGDGPGYGQGAPSAELLWADAFCSGLWARSAQLAVDWLAAQLIVDRPIADRLMAGPPTADRPIADRLMAGPPTADRPTAGPLLASGLEPAPFPLPSGAEAASALSVDAGRVTAIAGWRAAYDDLRPRLATDAAVTQVVRQRELEWTSFDIEELVLGTETAAREALLCSREDGMEAEEILRRAGGRLEARRARAGSLLPTVVAGLLAAPVGDGVTGPFRHTDGWSVIWLRDRRRPEVTDDDVRAEAADDLVREALDRELVGHLRWLGPT
jgi:hypothetical protein